MIKYILAEKGYYIEYDDVAKTSKVINKEEAIKQLAFSQSQLSSLPKPATDEQKIKYYDEHAGEIDTEKSRTLIQAEVLKLQNILMEIK